MVYEDTDAYWLGVLTQAALAALEALDSGQPLDAELALSQALRKFSESPNCSDAAIRMEIVEAVDA